MAISIVIYYWKLQKTFDVEPRDAVSARHRSFLLDSKLIVALTCYSSRRRGKPIQ